MPRPVGRSKVHPLVGALFELGVCDSQEAGHHTLAGQGGREEFKMLCTRASTLDKIPPSVMHLVNQLKT